MTILATTLNSILGAYIKSDQAGFLQGHYMRDRIRQVVNIVDWVRSRKTPTLMGLSEASVTKDEFWAFFCIG